MDSDPNYILIGRIVVSKKERGNSLGSYLIDFIIKVSSDAAVNNAVSLPVANATPLNL